MMLDAAQIEQMKAAMEEEHRKDREALQRLMRFLPREQRKNGNIAESNNFPVEDAIDADENGAGTYISAVEEILASQPERKWSVPKMIAELQSRGIQLKAQRPAATVGRIFRKLTARHKVRLVRRASGNHPAAYRAIIEGGASE